jgi:hypothetical protein
VSVDFDPVKLRPNRRRIDPVVIGVVVVIAALTLAVVKPWDARKTADVAIGSAEPAAAAAPPAASMPRATEPPGPPAPTWADIAPAVGAHQVWGVAAVVLEGLTAPDLPPTFDYHELWSASVAAGDGGETAYVARDDQSIVALGVTFPPGEVPADARIWRVHEFDQLEWIDARPVAGEGSDGTLLLVQPGSSGSTYTSWTGGRYRIDALVGNQVHRIAVEIPGRLGSVPAPDAWPAPAVNLVAARKGDPSVTRLGPFALVDGVSVGLTARLGPRLDEPGEWRAAISPVAPGERAVAITHLPRATGLGVMFTENAAVGSATIRRLAPDNRVNAAPAFGGISSLHGRTPYVVFAPIDGSAWPSGVYAISAAWRDPAGAHSGTWHIELRPGPLVVDFGVGSALPPGG